MKKREQKSTWPPSKTPWSRLHSRACAAALAIALCCMAVPVGASAVEDAPDAPAPSEEAQPSDSPESTDPDAGDNADADDQQSADEDGGTSENPGDDADQNNSPDADEPASEDSASNDTSNAESSTQTPSEEAHDDSSAEADSESADLSATESDDEDDEDDQDGKIEGEKKTKEEEALDKIEQANAIYDHMNRLADDIVTLQARCDKLEAAKGKSLSQHKKMQGSLKQEKKHLGKLKAEISDHIVKMYKQGRATPYLNALYDATSYKELLSHWHMLDKMEHYGESEFHEQAKAVKSLEAKIKKDEARVNKAKKKADEAQAKLNRTRLTYLSLAPHAASLEMEAAELLEDDAGLAAAQADYDSAYAELQNALDQGLAEAGRLEGEGIFTNPCPDATYSSGFGYRTFDNAYHLGLDMAIGEGTPYYAADDGEVIDATNGGGYNGGAGNWIVIDHGNGVVTKYMHSSVTFVNPGDTVVRGQNIGLVGNTGNSFGAHLHFQVEIDGVAVDPTIYL